MDTALGRRRIFVVPVRRDLVASEAVAHWMGSHGDLFAQTPEIGEYIQHLPTAADQQRLGGIVCSEISFVDKDTERRAFTCDYYVENVVPDENSFLATDEAWMALIRSSTPHDGPGGQFEALVFGWDGDGLPPGISAEVLDLDRPGPHGGPPVALVVRVGSAEAARAVSAGLTGDVVFAAQRTTFVAAS